MAAKTISEKIPVLRKQADSGRPEKEFIDAVVAGLSGHPKALPSKYLYDSRGDRLFQQITELPEYYLTRCEEQILRSGRDTLLRYVRGFARHFRLVELGAGDGKKTSILLSHFLKKGCDFEYMPADISAHVLQDLMETLTRAFPKLKIRALVKEYIMALEDVGRMASDPKLVLFLGGNIGNFSKDEAASFLTLLSGRLNPGDLLLTGFDLKKDPAMIYHAYNDRQGVTRSFTFNLLRRINRELDADFDPGNFIHYPTYDPQSGEMKSYLIAQRAHEVKIGATGTRITFAEWEPVFMEVSNKYSETEITALSERAGFEISEMLFDRDRFYVDVLFKKTPP